MKYQLEIEIDRPRDQVVALFSDFDNVPKWQSSLVSLDQLQDSDPNAVGAKSRQVHRMGKREIEMVQTITVSNPPDEIFATFEAQGVWNLVENRFEDTSSGGTRWIVDNEFRCGWMLTIMATLLPGMFRNQTKDFMQKFKEFAEKT